MRCLFTSISRAKLLASVTVLSTLAGCTSVDLGRRYDPPPVQAPQSVPNAVAPAPLPGTPQVQPIPPAQPVPQPLPPIGASAPVTSAPQQPVAPANPREHLVTLTTRIDGASVLPPTRSNGVGQLDALYDGTTRLLRWKTSWSGLSSPITGIQFHGPADQSQVGSPAMVWPGPFGSTYEGRATLTPQQANDLLQGLWYVNVFTGNYPAGEIRGQLRVVR